MKPLVLSLLAAAALSPRVDASATASFTSNQAIPDNDANGLLSVGTVTGSGIPSIGDVNVWLEISGGYSGDLHITLSHGTEYAVLFNRVGRTSTEAFGYTDEGFSSTFVLNDQAANGDVHTYRVTLFGNASTTLVGDLDGAWAPDGRTTDPAAVLDTDSRPALLSAFNGTSADGDWFLHAVDLAPGGEAILVNWGLEFLEGEEAPGGGGPGAVPEPSTWFVGALTTLALATGIRRRRQQVTAS